MVDLPEPDGPQTTRGRREIAVWLLVDVGDIVDFNCFCPRMMLDPVLLPLTVFNGRPFDAEPPPRAFDNRRLADDRVPPVTADDDKGEGDAETTCVAAL